MEDKVFDYLYNFEKDYWWHIARRELILRLIARHSDFDSKDILEIGCSTAGNAEDFGKKNRYLGADLSFRALELGKKRDISLILVNSNALSMPFKNECFDFVFMLDLIEHIEDDAAALKEAYRLLKKSGFLVVSVPALKILWREMDEIGQHKRRYNKDMLRKRIESSRFNILEIDYWGKLFFIPLLLYTFTNKLFKVKAGLKNELINLPEIMNNSALGIMRLENKFFNHFNIVGSSLVCICRKS